MNRIFKFLLMLFMLLAVVCLALFDVNARAAPDEMATQRENEVSILTNFAGMIANDICNYEFQRCSALLTYTQVRHNESLDADTIAGATTILVRITGPTAEYGPRWARSGRGADQSSRLTPALA